MPELDQRRVKDVFSEALALGGVERQDLLDRIGAAEPAIRDEVEDLLRVAGESEGFLETGNGGELDPIGARFGSFVVEGVLGHGGGGMVYRARSPDGVAVALKTILPGGRGQVEGLRREIAALARISHPGIVRILDHGVESGVPWYVMSLLDGPTLRQWSGLECGGWGASTTLAHSEMEDRGARGMAQPTGTAPSLAEKLEVITRLCPALSYLHGEGLVHRDLKPDNILVQEDGSPVIVDFGITRSLWTAEGRELLELHGDSAGTVRYMAPEQAQGDPVDARADLYSLGCIIWELANGGWPEGVPTGQRLFPEAEEPSIPPLVAGEIPAGIEVLVRQLLSVNPVERLGYADDVARRLSEVIGAGPEAPGFGSRPYVYRPRLTGRGSDLSHLRDRLSGIRRGEGRITLVVGESGAGKTRLVNEVATEARRSGLEVFLGQGPLGLTEAVPAGGAHPLASLERPLQRLADRCRELGLSFTERVVGDNGPILARWFPEFGQLPGQRRRGPVSGLPADAMRLRLHHALSEVLGGFAREFPFLLVLDDLQWADPVTVEWLSFMSRRESLGRWALLGTCRAGAVPPPLEEGTSGMGIELRRLFRLEVEDVGAMVSDMLALYPPPETFVGFLARESEGNPYFVSEYVRTAVAEGCITRDGAGAWSVATATEEALAGLPLPRSIEGLIAHRLKELPEKARETLDFAAILGRDIEASLLLEGVTGPEVHGAVSDLERRQILSPAEPGSLRFAHDKIREVAYRRMPPDRRVAGHRRAASLIQSRAVSDWGRLGSHWEAAGERDRARYCYLKGARDERRDFAYEGAEDLYRAYLRLVPPADEEAVRARIELSELLGGHHSWAEARSVLSDACRLAGELGAGPLQSEAQARFGIARVRLGEHGAGRALIEQSLDHARRAGDQPRVGMALARLALAYEQAGDTESSIQYYEEALDVLLGQDELEQVAVTLSNYAGLVYRVQGAAAGLQLYRRAIAAYRDAGNEPQEARDLVHASGCLSLLGRYSEARQLVSQGLELARRVGDRYTEVFAYLLRAEFEHALGNFDAALGFSHRVEEAGRELGFPFFQAYAAVTSGTIHRDRGQWSEAWELAARALILSTDDQTLPHALVLQGTIQAHRSETAAARLSFEQALELYAARDDRLSEATTITQLARLEARTGDEDRARTTFQEGIARCRKIGSTGFEFSARVEFARFLRESGRLEEARAQLTAAEAHLAGIEVRLDVLHYLCELGRLQISRSLASARETCRRAAEEARALDLEPGAEASLRVRELAAAVESAEPV